MKRLMILAMGTAALAAPLYAALAPGVQAPDFTTQATLAGKPFTFSLASALKTGPVVLYFYPAAFSKGCTIEAHNFQQDLPKYSQQNAVIVGVSVDTSDSHKEFCAKESLTFRLLSDTEKKVAAEYGSLGANGVASRNTFLIDPSGS